MVSRRGSVNVVLYLNLCVAAVILSMPILLGSSFCRCTTRYSSYWWFERTLCIIERNACLQSGHSAFTLLHVRRHEKQNWCKQESVNDLFLHVPRHIAQFGGGEVEPLPRCGLLSSLLTLLGLAPELSPWAGVDNVSMSQNFMILTEWRDVWEPLGGEVPTGLATSTITDVWLIINHKLLTIIYRLTRF